MILQEFKIDTKDFGIVKLARPAFGSIEKDAWGTLACLRGTPWGDLIPVITGEAMSHALHGRAGPMMRTILSPPYALLRKIPEDYRVCDQYKQCVTYDKTRCFPCLKVPECYVAPKLSAEQQAVANAVVLAWKEGRYVVVVDGGEFSF